MPERVNKKLDNCELPDIDPLQNSPRLRGSSRDALGSFKAVDDFELIELLGNGFFGKVYKVREKGSCDDDSEPLVMKIPIKHKQLCCESVKRITIKEDYMLRLLRHPNIIRSRGICVQRTSTYWQLNLLIDFCDRGSLQQHIINDNKPLSWPQRCCISRDVSNALRYVHEKGFIHRDLTSMNILLQSENTTQNLKAIVADFGLSERIPEFPKILPQVGSQNWMAPEVLREEFYNEKADVFSFGIIICQMIARIDADHDAGVYRTAEFGLDQVRFKESSPSDTPPEFLQMAFRCCQIDYKSRPSFEDLFMELQKYCQNN